MTGAVRRRVVVRGRVQGVGYRAWLARRADEAGLAGWVRNRPDGTVEAELEGDAPVVDALVARCREGPTLARVAALAVAEVAPTGEAGFGVRS